MRPILQAKLANAREVAKKLASEPEFVGATLYLSGSLTAGLGSSQSDIDIFVVGDGDKSKVPEQRLIDSTRVDIEFRNALELCSDHQRSLGVVPTVADPVAIGQISRGDLDDLVRFHCSEIVTDPSGIIRRLKDTLSLSIDHLAILLAGRHATDAANCAEDLVGALENEDGSAQWLSLELLLVSLESLLATRGELYIGNKWLWAKWLRSVAPEMPQLTDALAGPVFQYNDVPMRSIERLVVSQQVLSMAAAGATWEPVFSPDERVPRNLWPLPVSDGVVLKRFSGEDLIVSKPGVLLWGLAAAFERSDAILRTQSIMALQMGRNVSTEDIAAYYDALVDRGAIVSG